MQNKQTYNNQKNPPQQGAIRNDEREIKRPSEENFDFSKTHETKNPVAGDPRRMMDKEGASECGSKVAGDGSSCGTQKSKH